MYKKVSDFSRCLIECRDEYKYNVEAVELLIRNHLVNMQQYDLHLAQVRVYLLNRLHVIRSLKDLYLTFIFLTTFSILTVNGEWLELHGSCICHAVGEDLVGG